MTINSAHLKFVWPLIQSRSSTGVLQTQRFLISDAPAATPRGVFLPPGVRMQYYSHSTVRGPHIPRGINYPHHRAPPQVRFIKVGFTF